MAGTRIHDDEIHASISFRKRFRRLRRSGFWSPAAARSILPASQRILPIPGSATRRALAWRRRRPNTRHSMPKKTQRAHRPSPRPAWRAAASPQQTVRGSMDGVGRKQLAVLAQARRALLVRGLGPGLVRRLGARDGLVQVVDRAVRHVGKDRAGRRVDDRVGEPRGALAARQPRPPSHLIN